MKYMLLFAGVLWSFATAFITVHAQSAVSRIDAFVTNLDLDHNINGNLLVAENGEVLYERALGLANAASGQRNTQDTRFVMASVSKPFTAVAVFQLIEKGKLRLDEKVQHYLKNFPYPDVTLRHLLGHTSGLPNTEELFTPLLEQDTCRQYSNADLLAALKSLGKPLHFRPGSQFEYSNTNYSLLALLVGEVTGQPFAIYMHKRIFVPAGMNSTEILTPNFQFPAGYARKYDRPIHYTDTLRPVENIPSLRKFTYNWVGFQGPGNMASTTHDLLAFDQALYAGKLVSAQSMSLMFTPNRLNDGSIPYHRSGIDEAAYGLGWYIFRDTTNGKIVWHSGGIPGMNTFLLRNLAKKQLIVVTDNAQNPPVAPELYILLSGKPFFRPRSLALLYVQSLIAKGADYAAAKLGEYRKDPNYGLSEGELNFLGIELMENGQLPLALEVFKTNTLIYPESFNVFDSYGEALMKAGKKEEAILMYQRSITLKPGNEAGRKILERIQAQPR